MDIEDIFESENRVLLIDSIHISGRMTEDQLVRALRLVLRSEDPW